jgi:hypothetical protein
VPVLQQHGYHGSIQDFNTRVQSVHDTYQQAYGMAPSPGLTFDLARSKVDAAEFNKLFTVPLAQRAAKAKGAINAQGFAVPPPVMDAKQLATGIVEAAAHGDYHQYLTVHADVIHDLSSQHKNDAAVIAGGIFKARRLRAFRDVEEKINTGDLSPFEGHQQLQAMGFIPGGSAFHALKGVGGELALGIGQIADSLIHSPAGLYEVGKAIGLDTRDIVVHPTSPHFIRTGQVGKALVKGLVQDVTDPAGHPGFLFMDILGFASVGAGGVARVGAAGRVLEEGGALAAAKQLARKPPLTRVAIRHGELAEQMPLSQNPLVAAAQKFIVGRRQKGADARMAGDTPSGLRSILLPGKAQEFLDQQLSFETKVGREADVRKRVDHVAATTLARELDHVAGRAVTQARIHAAVPNRIRGALTRGEQKAIQVMSWDDPNPLQAEREFHQRMIDMEIGDPKAHRIQLADLKLAEAALRKPSPRFQKALELTQRVVADMERIKIEDLGLLPETAEGRVAKAGQTLRGEDLAGGEKVTPGSFYLPTQPRGKIKRPPSDRQGFYSPKAGPFGIPPGRDLPELTHEFTGKAIQAGNTRIDATSLATEAYGRTVRAATVRSEHAKLWDAGSATPYGAHSVAVRDINAIPDKLRTVVAKLDEGDFTPKDAEILPADMRQLLEALYPDKNKLTADEIEHVRWIDGRVLGEGNKNPHVPTIAADVANAVNAPLRFTTLFLRPAYILNKLGNEAMLLFDQGWMAIPNYAKALNMDARYGEDATRAIHEHVGAGKSRSYSTTAAGKFSTPVTEFWNKIADRGERAASFIYYMERKGYKTKDEVHALLNDPSKRADLIEVKRRANKALVEFDNLLPIEKNYIRHFLFVYPWVSRSVVWSIRAALEHPAKVDALAQLGRQDLNSDPIFKAAPAWFKRTGYIPLGFNHDGTPKVINPTSVNSFSTIGDFLALGRGATMGDKYASAEDFLGPAPKFLIHAVTGRDEFGNQYPGSQWWDAAKATLIGLPQVAAYQRGGKAVDKPTKLPNVADRASLETALNANLHKTVLSPGWLDGYGSLFAGGLSPRDVNMPALAARYWSDQDPKTRHSRELDLLNRALDIQAGVLKRPVSSFVRSAVRNLAEIDYGYKKFLKETGRQPSDKERANYTITYLTKQGLMPKGAVATWRQKLAPLQDTSDISRLKGHLLDKYANGKQLREWDTSIRTVASFSKPVFNQKAAELFAEGLSPQRSYGASQNTLYDYGRKYLAFTEQVKKMHADGATDAQLRAFQDENDVPVNGLPSFTRMAWINQPPEARRAAVQHSTVQSWSTLTAFDKALLGRPSDAKVTAGWAKLKEFEATQRAEAKRQGRGYPAAYTRTLAQYVERNFDAPGLVKDYDFSKQPLYQRMKFLSPVQNSPNKALWGQLFSLADHQYKALKSGDYSSGQLRQQWTDYVTDPDFQAWIGQHPGFKAEVQGFGKQTLVKLIGG